MSVVRIQNAHKYYNRGKGNELHVMNDISLALPESGMIAIFGKSGCGKTTLLNAIGGLDRIQSGTIELFGQNVREDTDTVRNRYVGYIFQNYNLNVTDTVFENVAAALRLCGLTDENDIAERVMAALRNVGMDKYRDRTPDTLSGGQQQRVAIARALVKAPAIILADEPTGNLDEANTVLVMDILKEISKSQLVLLVTHEADLVDYYCDRVIEIVDGRIVSDRQNRETRGYVRRDKNDIYLGELPVAETMAPGVKVAYYGEPAGELTLRIVSLNGKLYLKADGTDVKLLDESSEIRLREGVFEESPAATDTPKNLDGHTWDMSRLTPIHGTHYGRLFHFKNALIAAWRENFSKKQKRGRLLLRVCLVMLAVVMVFMTATIGAGIGKYTDLIKIHNESLYYVPVVPGRDYTSLNQGIGDHGISYTRLIGYSPLDNDYLSFNSSVFMTGRNVEISTQARAQDVVHAKNLQVVAGTAELKGATDILITSAVADRLIETSTVNYIDDHKDLIGMVSGSVYPALGGRMKIVGVVESTEVVYYMDSLALVGYVLENSIGLPVTAASLVGMEDSVNPGEFLFLDNDTLSTKPVEGETYTIMGNTLTLKKVIDSTGISMDEYAAYVLNTYGQTLPPLQIDGTPNFGGILEEWLPHLGEYVAECINTRSVYREVSFEEWVTATHNHIMGAGTLLSVEPYYLCAALLYHDAYGTYPATAEEAEAYAKESEVAIQIEQMLYVESLWKEYVQYVYDRESQIGYMKMETRFVLHDDDYRRLITHIGPTSDELDLYTYDHDYIFGDYYSHHLLIKSTDLAATDAFLRETVGEGNYITPDAVLEEQMNNIRADVILCVVSVLVILGLMCLCVYFIMRASFMSRVREVGILRAIGVTRRNLVYRFTVETALLISLTLVVGYLLSAYFIASLSGAPLFSEMFYFPLWLGSALLVIICAAAMFFGILPALVLLRRTPSEILAKYDI